MKMSKANKKLLPSFYKEAVLPAIHALKDGYHSCAQHAGICPNLLFSLRGCEPQHLEHFKSLMRNAMTFWPEYSGDVMYPIPSEWEHVSPRDYYLSGALWEGRQLELRLNLLQYLSVAVEKVIGMKAYF